LNMDISPLAIFVIKILAFAGLLGAVLFVLRKTYVDYRIRQDSNYMPQSPMDWPTYHYLKWVAEFSCQKFPVNMLFVAAIASIAYFKPSYGDIEVYFVAVVFIGWTYLKYNNSFKEKLSSSPDHTPGLLGVAVFLLIFLTSLLRFVDGYVLGKMHVGGARWELVFLLAYPTFGAAFLAATLFRIKQLLHFG
jgi:hypothetical protein